MDILNYKSGNYIHHNWLYDIKVQNHYRKV